MEIKRIGTQPPEKGSAEYFTGTVRIDRLSSPPEPSRVDIQLVTFEPGARTAWRRPNYRHELYRRTGKTQRFAG